jgi:drug/metabolite transporter (DMT)-like permease
MLNATVPLWATIFGAIWLGERFTIKRSGGLLLGVIGVSGLVGWSPVVLTTAVIVSIVAMLVASASYALAGIYIRKRMAGVSKPTLVLGQQVGAAAWLLLPAFFQARDVTVSGHAAVAVIALALLCTALAYPLYFHLIASVGPTRTTTVTYLIPLFGTAWGALFLNEPVTKGMIGGLTLILASVLLVNDVRFGSLINRRSTAPRSIVV